MRLFHIILLVIVTAFVILMLNTPYTNSRIEKFDGSPEKSSQESIEAGASGLYDWGYKPIPIKEVPMRHVRPKKTRPEFEEDIIIKEECTDITKCKDIDKFILKSSVPPCPDLSNYILKSEIPPYPNMDDYILKSEIPGCPEPDPNVYININKIKEMMPVLVKKYGSNIKCPQVPPCLKCPPSKEIMKTIDISEHPNFNRYISREQCAQNSRREVEKMVEKVRHESCAGLFNVNKKNHYSPSGGFCT